MQQSAEVDWWSSQVHVWKINHSLVEYFVVHEFDVSTPSDLPDSWEPEIAAVYLLHRWRHFLQLTAQDREVRKWVCWHLHPVAHEAENAVISGKKDN